MPFDNDRFSEFPGFNLSGPRRSHDSALEFTIKVIDGFINQALQCEHVGSVHLNYDGEDIFINASRRGGVV